eukprot:c10101_g1_i1.p1 GENE.c10101_g1_i1~~c10101_g1_i1.p1  ORF type:complete len:243 (+),score=55.82 c10101_g1_i1:57-785(+)
MVLEMSKHIVPPFRFAHVEEGISRGAFPSLKNYRFLWRLRLKCIISITPEIISDMTDFCDHFKVHHHHIKVDKFNDAVRVTPTQIVRFLEIVTNTDNHPVYVHCLDGGHIVGLFVMCLRKLQNWQDTAIINEFVRFVEDQEILKEEKEFVEGFSEKVTLPAQLPKWLWGGTTTPKHPSIPLAYLDPISKQARRSGTTAHVWDDPEITTIKTSLRQKGRVDMSTTVEALALEGLPLAIIKSMD